jgi:uncharacterized protein YegL
MNEFKNAQIETARNAEQKCLCVLCLDVSGSMSGAPINSLNQALSHFAAAIIGNSVARKRLELSIVTFDSTAQCVLEPDLVDYISMPTLKATGTTKLVAGVNLAIKKVADRKDFYRKNGLNHYRPFIILMTDGAPDESAQEIKGLAQEIKQGAEARKFTFWTVGSQGYDHTMLSSISYPYPPKALDGLKYEEFFEWLSATLITVSNSSVEEGLTPPPTDSWAIPSLSSNHSQTPI